MANAQETAIRKINADQLTTGHHIVNTNNLAADLPDPIALSAISAISDCRQLNLFQKIRLSRVEAKERKGKPLTPTEQALLAMSRREPGF